MKKYKIEVKEVLKKEVEVNASNPDKALDFVEKVYLKSNLLNFKEEKDENIESFEARVTEENGKKIASDDEFFEGYSENFIENLKEILAEASDEEIDELLEKIELEFSKKFKNYKIFLEEFFKILGDILSEEA